MAVLEGLKPEKVFSFFEQICEIPHGSRNTKELSDFIAAFAKERNLKYYQDEADNVVIYKEASAGYEDAPVTILQGHFDMVAEKTADSDHDFMKDGLKLLVEGDYVTAQDTTLGADDGIAVAYMMAVLDDDTLKHPALECVFTSDEEIGLIGAKELDASVLKGTHMINLDSDEEGYLWISCAGGVGGISTIPMEYQMTEGVVTEVLIDGLTGGHSGAEIDKNRANANKLMGRFLFELGQKIGFTLNKLEGGTKDNAITRASETVLIVDEADLDVVKETAATLQENLRAEYAGIDEAITIHVNPGEKKEVSALSMISKEKVVFFLMNVPFGVYKMSGTIEGLVETSSNLGILKLEEDALYVTDSIRSSVGSAKKHVSSQIQYLTEFLGGTYEEEGDYPAWEYKKDSKLRDLMVDVYETMFGEKPIVNAIHAGLECGLFYDKIQGLDCVSIGATMKDIHTTEERLSISSTERMWNYLIATLERMKDIH